MPKRSKEVKEGGRRVAHGRVKCTINPSRITCIGLGHVQSEVRLANRALKIGSALQFEAEATSQQW